MLNTDYQYFVYDLCYVLLDRDINALYIVHRPRVLDLKSKTALHQFKAHCLAYISIFHLYLRGVVAEWWCSVPSVQKVAGSNPTVAAKKGPLASPSLVVACMT